jgi:phosphohistidine phosphatase SixA
VHGKINTTARMAAAPVPWMPEIVQELVRTRQHTESGHLMRSGLLHSFRIVGLLAGFFVVACQTSSVNERAEEITTVILVRHAEKELVGDDPELTPAGAERALALAHVVGEVNVSAVYATPFARTRNTALPLADLLGLEVSVVAPGQSFAVEMAEIVRTEHVGETVVIVSHSNTTPAIIGELGVTPIPTIEDDEYDDLYVVTITSGGKVSLLPLRYGLEMN